MSGLAFPLLNSLTPKTRANRGDFYSDNNWLAPLKNSPQRQRESKRTGPLHFEQEDVMMSMVTVWVGFYFMVLLGLSGCVADDRTHSISGISGTVTVSSAGLQGVTITLSGTSSTTVTTDASGNFSFPSLVNGIYTVIPSKAGYVFNPTSSAQIVNSANITNVDFIATASTASTYTISGGVAASGAALQGVIMTLTGSSSATAATDASGSYSFTGLINGNYTVKPGKAGYTFTPPNKSLILNSANISGQDFSVVRWQTSLIDNLGDVGVGASIATDSNNNVHVSYYDITNEAIKYATNASGSWVTSAISTTVYGGGSSSQAAIKVDTNDKIHISYYDYNNGIQYMTNKTGAWEKTTIISSGWDVTFGDMVLGKNSEINIGYFTTSGLQLTTNATGTWVTSTVTAIGTFSPIFKSLGLAVDKNNKLHIVYGGWDGTTVYLGYANNITGSWVVTMLDSARSDYNGVRVAVDSSINIHAIYGTSPASGNLKYITNVSGGWVTVSIGDKGDNWSATSITVDTNDKIHVCAIGGTPRVQYITNASGEWAASRISDAQWSIALALDANNKPHIAYYAVPFSGPLMYATYAN
jgi:hypothetical protein